MREPRLIGTWRSDARKTAIEIAARQDIPRSSKSKLRRLFGKLELRYTVTRCYTKLGDYKEAIRYRVAAKDKSSVAIVTDNEMLGEQVVHIHFEKNHYWVCLGKFREYFRRVKR